MSSFDNRLLTSGNSALPRIANDSLSRATEHLLGIQQPDGSWEGEVVWNTMILSQYVIVCRTVGRPFDESTRQGMIHHYRVTRTHEGGWGMHPQSPPYVFMTTLAYVALRLLDVEADDPLTAGARQWLQNQPGGVLANPTWGKFWLSLIGLYGYEGINPFLPEMFLIPKWIPAHPDRLYCHTRNVFTAMAFLYGKRFTADLGPIGSQLRSELPGWTADQSVLTQHRAHVSHHDLHAAPGPGLRALYWLARSYERIHPRWLRRGALSQCLQRITAEQRTTSYRGLSPVNALLNCLALFASDRNHPELPDSLAALDYWRWQDGEEGVRYTGARSGSWDTAFTLEILSSLTPAIKTATVQSATGRAYAWLRDAQITRQLPAPQGSAARRDPILGGWCFSNGTDSWPVSDCTAEAVAALIRSGPSLSGQRPISAENINQAAEFILSRQNDDGGFATYERSRAPLWMERLNASEMFSRCMIDRSYIECTGSALHAFSRLIPYCSPALTRRIRGASARAAAYLLKQQRPDGSFEGSWGINFTYGTYHAVRGLRAAGLRPIDPSLTRASQWLMRTQKPDGGWGEHYTSSLTRCYTEHAQSQPIMTSWALLALLELRHSMNSSAVKRGCQWLCDNQHPDGSWDQTAVNGVFFGTGMLDYRLYATYFPTLAIANYLTQGPNA